MPIVFATYPLLAGAEKAHKIFNIVFFISLTSVIIQGTSLAVVAKWLHLTLPESKKPLTRNDIELSDGLKEMLTQIIIPSASKSAGKPIVELGLPKATLIAILERENKYITPSGSTVLLPGDKLTILSNNKEDIKQLYETLDIKPKTFKSGN
ncbi:MAG: hypothetical protein H7X84_01270 [Verrucomicrobia bacterium]|nr:hypothetical protein [Prolixibacteraceae bacterium]